MELRRSHRIGLSALLLGSLALGAIEAYRAVVPYDLSFSVPLGQNTVFSVAFSDQGNPGRSEDDLASIALTYESYELVAGWQVSDLGCYGDDDDDGASPPLFSRMLFHSMDWNTQSDTLHCLSVPYEP